MMISGFLCCGVQLFTLSLQGVFEVFRVSTASVPRQCPLCVATTVTGNVTYLILHRSFPKLWKHTTARAHLNLRIRSITVFERLYSSFGYSFLMVILPPLSLLHVTSESPSIFKHIQPQLRTLIRNTPYQHLVSA